MAKPGDDNWAAAQKKSSGESSGVQSSAGSYHDRDEESEASQTASEGFNIDKTYANEQEEMINITSCSYVDFSKYMSKQYGDKAFTQGYATIKKEQALIYEENGEDKLIAML